MLPIDGWMKRECASSCIRPPTTHAANEPADQLFRMFSSPSPASPSAVPSSSSSHFPRFPRRRISKKSGEVDRDSLSLSRSNDSNTNSTKSMVDTAPLGGRPLSQARNSFFNNFSFRGRTHSNTSTPSASGGSYLGAVKEGEADELGARRQRPELSNTSSSSASTQPSQLQQKPAQPPPQDMQPLLSGPDGSQRQLHPEIRSVVQLSNAHARKIYMSGELVKHVERLTDGKIVGKEEPWRRVWAQLGGTTLSVWDMQEIEEASRRGAEVPPTYINITDASIHVLVSYLIQKKGKDSQVDHCQAPWTPNGAAFGRTFLRLPYGGGLEADSFLVYRVL